MAPSRSIKSPPLDEARGALSNVEGHNGHDGHKGSILQGRTFLLCCVGQEDGIKFGTARGTRTCFFVSFVSIVVAEASNGRFFTPLTLYHTHFPWTRMSPEC